MQLETLLDKIIQRILKLLTKAEHLIEEEGTVYLANTDADNVLAPAASGSNHVAHRARPARGAQSAAAI